MGYNPDSPIVRQETDREQEEKRLSQVLEQMTHRPSLPREARVYNIPSCEPRQSTELIKVGLLSETIHRSKLPMSVPTIFSGDPMEFVDF